MSDTNQTIRCRLCSRPSTVTFSKRALGRHIVKYYRCSGCYSMQTEPPYWLDEAYAIPGVHIDVGGASRTLKNWVGLSTLLGRLGCSREALAVDFGAASGLLGRLMRDTGYNFHSNDKYARPAFTSYFNVDSLAGVKPQVITAFEVFEHLTEPAVELNQLFSLGAPLIVFSTWFCDGQNEDWIYFVPECGQHVFFYTEQAMRDIASTHGYELRSSAFFHILSKPTAFTPEQRTVINDYTISGASWAHSESAELIASVCMGNSFIDSDFEAARARFSAELEARQLVGSRRT